MNRDPRPSPVEESRSPGSPEKIDLKVQPGQRLRLDAQVNSKGRVSVHGGISAALLESVRSGRLYAVLALLIAGVVLLTGLTRCPPQVTPDEVYPSLRGVDLLQNNFKGEDGALLPAFLPGSTPFATGTGAYLQMLPQLFRPNTLAWVRGLNALLGLLAALLITAWLRLELRLSYAWALLPLLAGIPAWFYFSRTGLDIALAVALSMAALGCYGFYRAGRVKFIYGAAAAAMLAFYAAPAARLAVPTAVVLLVLVDWRYHRVNRRVALRAALLAAVMAVPLVIFMVRHPDGIGQEWLAAGSFLAQDSSPWIKLGRFLLNTLNAFNPFYWFLPDGNAPAYYRMGGYPPLPYLLAPFVLLGGFAALKKLRDPTYRILWVGWLAAAVGAAPYGGRLPELLLAVPVLAVMGVLGLHEAASWLQSKWKPIPAWLPGLALIIGVGFGSLVFWADALYFSPNRLIDYGRSGLQYGAPQIYGAAVEYAGKNPWKSVLVWPEWSTDPEALRHFFAPETGDRVRLGMVDSFLYKVDLTLDEYAFVIPSDQVVSLQASGKFDITAIDQIAYPDNSPAFSLVELAYTPQAGEIMAQETVKRRELVTDTVRLEGELVTVRHSALDLGALENLFDGIPESLARSAEANPLVIELVFPEPRRIDGVILQLGSEPVTVTAIVNPGSSDSLTVSVHGDAVEGMKELGIALDENVPVETLRLEVRDESAEEPAHVHLWEIKLINR